MARSTACGTSIWSTGVRRRWPCSAPSQPRWLQPGRPERGGAMHYAGIIEAIADRMPEAEALVHHGSVRRSWAAYDQRAARLASAFTAAGLGPGATVGLFLYNC